MEDYIKQEIEAEKDLKEYNEKILSQLGETAIDDFEYITEGLFISGMIEFVKEPSGTDNKESCGIFKRIFCDQSSIGDSGDSFVGYIFAEIEKDKWLQIPFGC